MVDRLRTVIALLKFEYGQFDMRWTPKFGPGAML